MKNLILGIDTGGTHTDAVIFSSATSTVLTSAKAETTHHDLAEGISQALENLGRLSWPGGFEAVGQINLSTTLATNSIAEGLSNKVGLIMMGYDADQEAVKQLVGRLPLVEAVFVSGSHNFYGQEDVPLDEEALSAAALNLKDTVSGWAVSGFFSVKNPAHELRAARLIKSVSDKPVTLGRDLTGEYDAVRRAATAALNAGLVVIINRLLDAVKLSADRAGLTARLMVVKGDGSLVSEDWAREKPIETVVSGPAASLTGAKVLGRGFLSPAEKNLWVLDVGGTTTDMAFVKNGRPVVNPNGARVGQWNTMTMAVETRTRGLGGDSLVRLEKEAALTLGPRRVLPLCRLGEKWPDVVQTLMRQKALCVSGRLAGCFFIPGTAPEPGLNDDEAVLLEALSRRTPLALATHAENCFNEGRRFGGLAVLKHPSIMVSAFTPTDAMSILGLYGGGSRQAAVLGAELLGRSQGLGAEQVATMVLEEFGRLLAEEVVAHGLESDGFVCRDDYFGPSGVFGDQLGRKISERIKVSLEAADTIMLLGAPAAVLAPFMGRCLKGRILVPPVYGMASAAGAAASPVYLRRKVEIHTLPNFIGFRLFLPNAIIDGDSVDELVEIAEREMNAYMRNLADLAGADQRTAVACVREDRLVKVNDSSLNLGASLDFTVEAA